MISKFIDKHPFVFWSAAFLILFVLVNLLADYSRECKRVWGTRWEGTTKQTVYEFNGPFCALIRYLAGHT